MNDYIILGILILVFIFRRFVFHLPELIYWLAHDIRHHDRNYFKEFGMQMYCGRQGSGKTVGMVWTLERMRRRYPRVKIYTNFAYQHETAPLTGWQDLLSPDYRNGTNGVIFAIDEIQNEFSSLAWKDFPESLLSEITQQRKQRICILASSQVYTRVVKQLREQCYRVVECKTILGRYTRLKCYDAEDYNVYVDNPDPAKKFKMHKLWKRSFVQSNALRGLYDTWAKVARLSRIGFVPKQRAE